MKSDTPRTDEAEIGYRDKQRVPADFARSIERELNDCRTALDKQISVTLGQLKTIHELRQLLAHKNETANTFMAQIIKLQRAAAMPNDPKLSHANRQVTPQAR